MANYELLVRAFRPSLAERLCAIVAEHLVRTREAYVFTHRSAIACFAPCRQILNGTEFRAALMKRAAGMRAKRALKTSNKEITAPKMVL